MYVSACASVWGCMCASEHVCLIHIFIVVSKLVFLITWE